MFTNTNEKLKEYEFTVKVKYGKEKSTHIRYGFNYKKEAELFAEKTIGLGFKADIMGEKK